MTETVGRESRSSFIGRLWFMPLTQRLAVLAGLALIGAGFWLILSSSDVPDVADVQAVTRRALGGMALVVCGAVLEVLVLLGRAQH